MERHGFILERTIHDLNEIRIIENDAEIYLYNRENKLVNKTIIDAEDVIKINKYKWHLTNNGYVYSEEIKMYLHRYLLNANINEEVDHIDRNPLNNKKENLRMCTQQQNTFNQSLRTDNTSGVTGYVGTKNQING